MDIDDQVSNMYGETRNFMIDIVAMSFFLVLELRSTLPL